MYKNKILFKESDLENLLKVLLAMKEEAEEAEQEEILKDARENLTASILDWIFALPIPEDFKEDMMEDYEEAYHMFLTAITDFIEPSIIAIFEDECNDKDKELKEDKAYKEAEDGAMKIAEMIARLRDMED